MLDETDMEAITSLCRCETCDVSFAGHSRSRFCRGCLKTRIRERAAKQMAGNRFLIFNRDGNRCMYCGSTPADGVKLVPDHVVPVVEGGSHTADNLITSCVSCNSAKSGSEAPEWVDSYLARANAEHEIDPKKLIKCSATQNR